MPRLLDLFCCQGGAGMGYHRVHFTVYGVDVEPQPRYPFPFHLGDALEVLARLARGEAVDFTHPDGTVEWLTLADFDAVHASPPCHDHTPLKSVAGTDGTDWLLPATRARLTAIDIPWVIENVAAAVMVDPITLCGGMFGLRTYRHRRFESNLPLVAPPWHPKHLIRTATKQRRARWDEGWHVSITGDVGTYVGPEGMGIDWMDGNGLSQAIPPRYTAFIGRQLIAHLPERAA